MKSDKYNLRTDLSYDPLTGYWLDIAGNTARIGMSPLAQETTGAFVALRMEQPGAELEKGAGFGSVEAEKHVGQLLAPVSGRISAVNEKVLANPRLLNTDPYGNGWLLEIDMSKADTERPALLENPAAVLAWFESEIAKFEEKGWLAE